MKCIFYGGCKSREIHARLLCVVHYHFFERKVKRGQKTWEQFEIGGYVGPSRQKRK